MAELADGVDNIDANGVFQCDGHSGGMFTSDRFGGARWNNDRWTRGTAPAGGYTEYECRGGHNIRVDDGESTPLECSTCRSTELRLSGGTHWGENRDKWPYDTIVPRTCSFCGGVHPEDLIELTKAGFRPERSDKGYKYYINGPDGKGLLPPVKFYTNHGNADHFKRLNEALGH